MASHDHPGFSAEAVSQAIEAAQAYHKSNQPKALGADMTIADGSLKISAQCISVTVQNGQVCVNLPLGIGSVCLPIPSWVPNGTAAKACIDLCTKWGIPCGVELTISVAGQQIIQKGFGCSC